MPPKTTAPETMTPENDKPLDADTSKPAEMSAVDKVKSEVEPVTDLYSAIEKALAGQADAFKVAAEIGDVEAHEVASQFAARAKELAEAVLAGVEAEWAKAREHRDASYRDGGAAGTGGVAAVEREQPAGLKSPMAPAATLQDEVAHNQHVVDAASEAGMEPALAHQMSTHGSNN